jgi:hypothetical protein
MNAYKVITDLYRWEADSDSGTVIKSVIMVTADEMRVKNGTLLLSVDTRTVAAFAKGKWDYVSKE